MGYKGYNFGHKQKLDLKHLCSRCIFAIVNKMNKRLGGQNEKC